MNEVINYLLDALTHKLAWGSLFVIGGILFVLFRWIHFQINKKTHENIILAIQKDPTLAKAYRDTLDIPYGSVKFPREYFDQLIAGLRNIRFVGPYQIKYIYAITQHEILMFTTLPFVDFDIGVIGSSEDTHKTAHHNFLAVGDPESSDVKIFSTLYTDTNDKFQKEAFASTLAGIVNLTITALRSQEDIHSNRVLSVEEVKKRTAH